MKLFFYFLLAIYWQKFLLNLKYSIYEEFICIYGHFI